MSFPSGGLCGEVRSAAPQLGASPLGSRETGGRWHRCLRMTHSLSSGSDFSGFLLDRFSGKQKVWMLVTVVGPL